MTAATGIIFLVILTMFKVNISDAIANPETTTPNGCTCNSDCGATVHDGFKEDWCKVDGNCGKYSYLPSVRSYWDYCLYKYDGLKPQYRNLDWRAKHGLIWAKVTEDESLGANYPADAFKESLKTAFENEWDFLPEGRRKAIHGVGAVCQFTMNISNDSPYTGVFKAGETISGLIRMGSAQDLPSMVPGIAVKILRTGTMSANLVALHTFDPLPNENYNFFAVPVSNFIDAEAERLATKVLERRFCQATDHCINRVGVSNFCTHDQNGHEESSPVFPFRITFEPAEVQFPEEEPDSVEAFHNQFKAIAIGTKLYTVRTMRDPEDTEGFVLGDMITTDICHPSKYGDTVLAFKHQWVSEDVALKPEWRDAYDESCECNEF